MSASRQPKRTFFNKPSWASRGDEDTDSAFYRRAGQTYKDIIASNKNDRARLAGSFPNSPQKRCRISDEARLTSRAEEDSDNNSGGGKFQEDILETTKPSDGASQESPDGDVRLMQTTLMPDNAISPDKSPIQSSQSHQPLSPETNPPSPPHLDTISSNREDTSIMHDSLGTMTQVESAMLHSDANSTYDNTVVQILITSSIKNTKPLIVHRKMAQSLKRVRLAWCNRQNLPKDLHSSIFLTWKGRRLFDVTTCRSLGIDAQSVISQDLAAPSELGGNLDNIQIHMEAVTEEHLITNFQSQEFRTTPGSSPTTFTCPQTTETSHLVQIIMKCPGFDDLTLSISLNQQVFEAVTVFRDANNICEEVQVYFSFDGDRLDPQSCFSDYEIADGDLIDVIIKNKI
ncbi:hypothetical protein ARAM_006596 [Aspergillus rambellii]|uniref:Rad60/SUMO-like domain-containing protein n=1 Tax=Aspergillus rambellii TaxID=308745 RepID=A0A0F8UG76_9EURO|nr:hypothetical protein ARAM_006596 [Aspergillus rambellii]